MQTSLPKLATAALVVIAVSLTLIAYKLYNSAAQPEEEKVIYIDAASGKVYEKKGPQPELLESSEEKLRKQYPGGKTY